MTSQANFARRLHRDRVQAHSGSTSPIRTGNHVQRFSPSVEGRQRLAPNRRAVLSCVKILLQVPLAALRGAREAASGPRSPPRLRRHRPMNDPEPSDKPPAPVTPQAAKPDARARAGNDGDLGNCWSSLSTAILPLVPACWRCPNWLLWTLAIGVFLVGFAKAATIAFGRSMSGRERGIVFGILIAIPLAMFMYLFAVCPRMKFGS